MNVISFLEHVDKIKKEYHKINKKFNKKNLGAITKNKYKVDPVLTFSDINDPFNLNFEKTPKSLDLNEYFKPIKNWNEFIKMHVLGPYISHSYASINNLNKTENIISDYYYLLISLILNKIIHKFSETKVYTVYRGVRSHKSVKLDKIYKEKGKKIKESKYISTSLDPIIAYNFANRTTSNCCYFIIKLSKGVKYIPTSSLQFESREAEFLIARNTEFVVDEVKDNFVKMTAKSSEKLNYDTSEILEKLKEFVTKIAEYNGHFNPYVFQEAFLYANEPKPIKIKQKNILANIISTPSIAKKIFTPSELNKMKEFVEEYI